MATKRYRVLDLSHARAKLCALNCVTFVQKLKRLAPFNDIHHIAIAALRNHAHVKPANASLVVTACGHTQHSNGSPIYPGLSVD